MKTFSNKSLQKLKKTDKKPFIDKLPLHDNEEEMLKSVKTWLLKLSKLLIPTYDQLVQALQDEWEKIHVVELPDYSSGESLYLDAQQDTITMEQMDIAKAKEEIERGQFVMGQARLMRLIHKSLTARLMLGLYLINDTDSDAIQRGYVLLLVAIQQGLQHTTQQEKFILQEALHRLKQYIFTMHQQDVQDLNTIAQYFE